MSYDYNDDSLALHTDLYQINMMKTYWDEGITEKHAIFELYFRKYPFNNGYAVYAGLERFVSYLQNLRFTDTDIAYLREHVGYDEGFLEYLKISVSRARSVPPWRVISYSRMNRSSRWKVH